MSTRIVIFDDHTNLAQSLEIVLNGVEGYKVCGCCQDFSLAAEIIHEHKPNVVILDIDMHGVDAMEAIYIIKKRTPATLIIIYTLLENEDLLFECLHLGANGYILKNTSFVVLLDAIDIVLHGGAPLSPTIAARVLKSFQQRRPVFSIYKLSERETEVLSYLVKGCSYKMIAENCSISLDTVRGHIRNIYAKLHVNSGREAVAKALRYRMI